MTPVRRVCEVLTSTGNGRFCSRAAAEWEDVDGVHCPGTYAHGIYNRETTILGGVPVGNEDLVNLPHCLVLCVSGERMPRFEGAIFDVDGVLVDSPHEKAWREALRELMEGDWADIRDRTTWSPEAFTSRVYEDQLSGKPRMSGARAALAYFHVPDDEEDHRLLEYAQRKQAMVVRLIEAGDFTAYPDALRFLIALKDAGLRVGAASSSKNANLFLSKIRLDLFAEQQGISSRTLRPGLTLLEYFDADVSGRDFAHGKPDPEIFLTAAGELGVAPEAAIVMEDAPAGVEAAEAGAMGAIGIARRDDAELLAAAGADIVVKSLDEVDLQALSEGRLAVTGAAA